MSETADVVERVVSRRHRAQTLKRMMEERKSMTRVLWGKAIPIKSYVKAKVRLLERDFLIPVSEDDILRMLACKNEIQVDNIARTLIKKSFEDD